MEEKVEENNFAIFCRFSLKSILTCRSSGPDKYGRTHACMLIYRSGVDKIVW